MAIPARLHFCWIGHRLPWAYVFALLSAAERSEVPRITLHHTDTLEETAGVRALKDTPCVRLSRIDPMTYLTRTGRMLGIGGSLATLYHALDTPVMRSDVLRAAILYSEGGIYLDLDTVTVASLLPLTSTRNFVGCERIVWPQSARRSRSPALLLYHLTLDLIRHILRRTPHGWRTFRVFEKFYSRSANNAAMGAEANSSFMADYLRAMPALPAECRTQRYALGPHLLQAVVKDYASQDLVVHDPKVFYPLAPEISEHWFRIGMPLLSDSVLFAETRAVHWYATVRTKRQVDLITPGYVVANRHRQLYSALVYKCLGAAMMGRMSDMVECA